MVIVVANRVNAPVVPRSDGGIFALISFEMADTVTESRFCNVGRLQIIWASACAWRITRLGESVCLPVHYPAESSMAKSPAPHLLPPHQPTRLL